jgi:hypothetical protein
MSEAFFIMITIYKGTVNKVVVTVSEMAVNPCNPIYLFQFTNSQTKEQFFCIATDQVQLTRYNAFCITETEDPNPADAEVFFPLLGQYDYIIYEDEASTLNPDGLNICETGKCQVLPDAPPVVPQYESNVYPQYQIYGN